MMEDEEYAKKLEMYSEEEFIECIKHSEELNIESEILLHGSRCLAVFKDDVALTIRNKGACVNYDGDLSYFISFCVKLNDCKVRKLNHLKRLGLIDDVRSEDTHNIWQETDFVKYHPEKHQISDIKFTCSELTFMIDATQYMISFSKEQIRLTLPESEEINEDPKFFVNSKWIGGLIHVINNPHLINNNHVKYPILLTYSEKEILHLMLKRGLDHSYMIKELFLVLGKHYAPREIAPSVNLEYAIGLTENDVTYIITVVKKEDILHQILIETMDNWKSFKVHCTCKTQHWNGCVCCLHVLNLLKKKELKPVSVLSENSIKNSCLEILNLMSENHDDIMNKSTVVEELLKRTQKEDNSPTLEEILNTKTAVVRDSKKIDDNLLALLKANYNYMHENDAILTINKWLCDIMCDVVEEGVKAEFEYTSIVILKNEREIPVHFKKLFARDVLNRGVIETLINIGVQLITHDNDLGCEFLFSLITYTRSGEDFTYVLDELVKLKETIVERLWTLITDWISNLDYLITVISYMDRKDKKPSKENLNLILKRWKEFMDENYFDASINKLFKAAKKLKCKYMMNNFAKVVQTEWIDGQKELNYKVGNILMMFGNNKLLEKQFIDYGVRLLKRDDILERDVAQSVIFALQYCKMIDDKYPGRPCSTQLTIQQLLAQAKFWKTEKSFQSAIEQLGAIKGVTNRKACTDYLHRLKYKTLWRDKEISLKVQLEEFRNQKGSPELSKGIITYIKKNYKKPETLIKTVDGEDFEVTAIIEDFFLNTNGNKKKLNAEIISKNLCYIIVW
eukprot:UN32907